MHIILYNNIIILLFAKLSYFICALKCQTFTLINYKYSKNNEICNK